MLQFWNPTLVRIYVEKKNLNHLFSRKKDNNWSDTTKTEYFKQL